MGRRNFIFVLSNPPPLCVSTIPGIKLLGRLCIEFYDINFNDKSACVRVIIKIWIVEKKVDLFCFKVSERTVGILSATEFRTFWISWNFDRIQVGRGSTVGQKVFMQYLDPFFTPVHFVSVCTAWGATGEWTHRVAKTGRLATPDQYKYTLLQVEGQDSYVFSVKATNDAHVLLHQREKDVYRDIYEFVLGGWNNTRSVIRDVQQQKPPLKSAETPEILNGDEWRIFWVSANSQQQTVSVGRGRIVGQREIMSYNDFNFTPVHFISVSTGWGATGQWEYSYSKIVELHTPNLYRYVPLPELDLGKIDAKTSFVFRVKASNDAHVLLQEREDDVWKDIYENVLGGWNNTKSAVRKQRQGPTVASVATPGLLNSTEFRTFWVSWDLNTIRVGRGHIVGAGGIWNTMTGFASASTGWNATGVWKYDVCVVI